MVISERNVDCDKRQDVQQMNETSLKQVVGKNANLSTLVDERSPPYYRQLAYALRGTSCFPLG